MRSFRLFPVVLSLAAIPSLPVSARAMIVQDPEAVQPMVDEDEYESQSERDRRDQRREEQRGLQGNFATVKDTYVADPCGLGCGDHEGLQTQAIPGSPLVGVVHQANREDGVLTLRFRFYNDGSEPARLTIDPSTDHEAFFVRVGREKLFIVKDEDGELEAKEPLEVDLKPGKMESWWAKFPAPAADTEAFDLEIPPVATFTDVPITDD